MNFTSKGFETFSRNIDNKLADFAEKYIDNQKIKSDILKWELIDADSHQYIRKAAGTDDIFDLIEMSMINPEINEYEVYQDTVCTGEYIAEKQSELLAILDCYGYHSVDEVIKKYKSEAMQVIAECIFEYYGSSEVGKLFVGSEKECTKYIQNYISE